MIPTYEISNLTGNLDTVFKNIMLMLFIISIITLTCWIIVSLLIWFFGANKKSEKAIKFGVKNVIVSVALMVIILLMPVLLTKVKIK